MTTDPVWMTAAELTAGYRAGRLTPVDALRAIAARVASVNPRINAFYELADAAALEIEARVAAARWKAGAPLGPLDGVPVSIKDHIHVRGLSTPRGSFLTGREPSRFDSPASARLREGGALILGKTTMPELSVIPVTDSVAFGATLNPWSLHHSPGGSSGGAAAAVAAGLGPLAVGSDGGGSIRLPAAFTGLSGLKPTLGRVPYWPGQTDRTVSGPIGRTVHDVALMLNVIGRPDGRDWMELSPDLGDFASDLDRGVAGLRIGWSADFGFVSVDGDVRDCCVRAVEALAAAGAHVEPLDKVGFDVFEIYMIQATLRLRDMAATVAPADLARFPEAVHSVLRLAGRLTPADIQTMFDRRNALADQLLPLFGRVDAIVSPAAPFVAPRLGALYPEGDIGSDANRRLIGFAAPFNLVHMPALAVPVGFSPAGLPIGLQIAGPKLSERLLLRVGAAVERAAGVAGRRPPAIG